MTIYTLTLLDTSSIQDYVFGSNQLAQNIGASELVELATGQWLIQSLNYLNLTHNMKWSASKGVEYTDDTVEKVDVEAIYAGGGNAVLIFTPGKDAKQFIHHHSRHVLKNARGLQLQAVFKTFEWDPITGKGESIAETLNALRKEVFAQKMKRPVSTPIPGLSVTAACVYTGLPATGRKIEEIFPDLFNTHDAERLDRTNQDRPISKEVADKLRAEPDAKERLHNILVNVRSAGYEFVYDFEQFGDKGTSSYIAVVHTDGNGMGKRFDEIAKIHNAANREYIKQVRALSQSVRTQADKALKATADYLIAGLKKGDIKIAVHKMSNIPLLPFRPIVFGGDDVTFVCDGRLGLQLANVYLKAFTEGHLSDDKPIFARAGIAVVKTHFPFSRAYDLSEDLARNAKESINELKEMHEEGANVMDWHFSTTGVIRPLKDLRQREYQAKINNRSLLLRPIRVDSKPGVWRTWETLEATMKGFKDKKKWPRNKMKDLQSALRGGSDEVKVFLKNYHMDDLPKIPAQPGLEKTGWLNNTTCGYFDALEAIDFVEIKPQETAA